MIFFLRKNDFAEYKIIIQVKRRRVSTSQKSVFIIPIFLSTGFGYFKGLLYAHPRSSPFQ